MRSLVGDPRWCFARITVNGKTPVAGDIRPAGEQIGSIIGDHIAATYGFDAKGGPPVVGHFTTFVAKAGVGSRYWVEIRGTKGLIHLGLGISPIAMLCEDPAWMPGKSKAIWQPISSEGLGKPDAPMPPNVANGNIFIVNDLIDAIEQDRAPLDSLSDGRASLEMILAVYESFRLGKPVDFPLKTRKHPLSLL